MRRPLSRTAGLRESPEPARQPDPLEDRLVLLPRVRAPVRRQPVAPPAWPGRRAVVTAHRSPGCRPASQRSMCSSDRKRFIVLQVKTMSSHHRAAGTRQWKTSVSSSGRLVADLDRDRLAAVRARRLDPPVDAERSADPERVPGAVRVPLPAAGVDAEGRRDSRERVRHPDLTRRRRRARARARRGGATSRADIVGVEADRTAGLVGGRRAAELHEKPVGGVAQVEIGVVDRPIVPEGASAMRRAEGRAAAALGAPGDDPDQ